MQKDIKEAWLKNLRREDVEQCKYSLCEFEFDIINDKPVNFAYCCLGVLLDTIQREFPEKVDFQFKPNMYNLNFIFEKQKYQSYSFIPEGFCGLKHEEIVTLSSMNDNELTFAKIADWIETNIPTE